MQSRGSRCRAQSFETSPPWKNGGVYLISGGAGGLGFVFAEAIATGVRKPTLVLVGRSALTTAQAARVSVMQESGCRAIYRQADISIEAEVVALVRAVETEFGRIDGVLHAAGVTRDGFLLE